MKKCFCFIFLIAVVNCSIFQKTRAANFSHNPLYPEKGNSDIRMYWIGHATVLIKLYDKWIITDPNFSQTTGLVIKRFVQPAIDLKNLPRMDLTLISHTHFDHLDKDSLKFLKGSDLLLVPSGGKSYIPANVFNKIIAVKKQKIVKHAEIKITAVPVQHFGGRYLIDNLWDGEPYTGYIIEYKDATIFFAGDTGYHPELFKNLGKRFDIDIALIPVGPVSRFKFLRFISKGIHVNPAEAMQLFKDTRAHWMLPIHHGTFYRHGADELQAIRKAILETSFHNRVLLKEAGEVFHFNLRKKVVQTGINKNDPN